MFIKEAIKNEEISTISATKTKIIVTATTLPATNNIEEELNKPKNIIKIRAAATILKNNSTGKIYL